MAKANTQVTSISYLELLKDQIDITRVPFSDRGSRILVLRVSGKNQLYIKLAERLLGLEPGLEDYFHRPPFIDDLYLVGDDGNPLEFEVTTSAERLQFHTSLGDFQIVFQDQYTLAFGLPPDRTCGLRFRVRKEYCLTTDTDGELKAIRLVHYATNCPVVKTWTATVGEEIEVELIVESQEDSALTLHVSPRDDFNPQVLPFSLMKKDAESRWLDWFNKIPPVADRYREKYVYAWWVMANNLVSPSGLVTYESMMPTKAYYIGLWLWDSALHALALRYADIELARNQLRVMLSHQLPDGMLPDVVFDEGIISELDHPFHAAVTKPPILTWMALKLHESHPDMDFLREIYDPLARCNDWWLDENANGLAQYAHPFSSGLDNSPLWDYGMPAESPDINTYLSIQMDGLASIAEALGKDGDARKWRSRSDVLVKRMIEVLWDKEAGLFQALCGGSPIPVVTPFNLYPLWTGKLPETIKGPLIQHLQNTDEFCSKYPLPTVARNDPAYNHEAMWRGPVWANINYFFIEALQKTGEYDLARDLRDKTLEMIMSNPGIYEYYSSENGKPPLSAAPMFGWTASVFIELAIQASNELSPEQR
jgi:putative isomerase